jgi:hypothetical protein
MIIDIDFGSHNIILNNNANICGLLAALTTHSTCAGCIANSICAM